MRRRRTLREHPNYRGDRSEFLWAFSHTLCERLPMAILTCHFPNTLLCPFWVKRELKISPLFVASHTSTVPSPFPETIFPIRRPGYPAALSKPTPIICHIIASNVSPITSILHLQNSRICLAGATCGGRSNAPAIRRPGHLASSVNGQYGFSIANIPYLHRVKFRSSGNPFSIWRPGY